MSEFLLICSAFSAALALAAAAGLNAYVPLLVLAIMSSRAGYSLPAGYQFLSSPWVLILLTFLFAVEIIVDKISRIDAINDRVQCLIRPAAGAFLFALQMVPAGGSPIVWMTLGLLVAGIIHFAKMVSRPIINYGSPIGAPIVSLIEDLIAMTLTILALLVPLLAPILIALFTWILIRLFRRHYGGWRKSRRVYRVLALPVRTKGNKAIVVPAVPITAATKHPPNA